LNPSHRRGAPSPGGIGGLLAVTPHSRATRCPPQTPKGTRPPTGPLLPPPHRKGFWPPAGPLLARDHRMERQPLRLRPRASHPAVTRRARRGGDRPFVHWPGYYTFAISRTSKRCPPLHSCTLMSHIIAGGLHHRAGDSLGNQMLTQCQDL